MKINQSATKAATIRFNNGNEVDIYIGLNSNLGSTIVWQKFGKKVNKFTGRNIAKLWAEINDAISKGECNYVYSNATCISVLTKETELTSKLQLLSSI